MEGASVDDFPCSSLTADSFIRIGLAGSAWGLFLGPYEAKKKGLTGHGRASFVVKSVGKYGLQCGLFAGVFTATRCGVRRYRMENDWVNACIAGAVTGAAVAVRTRNWMQIVGTATIVSAIATVTDYSTAN
ncbi:outer envelope pore protein 16-4, chloroplastic [Cinnamomum micranthum f. kanehirae]|uniref:Outer envelope pore protein 16-4, chloroplastic n=1 Tax=Cinnamomum micranthum f. kanehirae TaxID=337451 RepID=A0A3S3N2F4_9MAGN|nr:outer envelope pore protein 16-4, chloroplastic [Cinnamomum micranthum f. kanehirae]